MFALFVQLMLSKLCFYGVLLASKVLGCFFHHMHTHTHYIIDQALRLATAITLLPLLGLQIKNNIFYSLRSWPVIYFPQQVPSLWRQRAVLSSPWRDREEAAAQASNWLPVLCSGVHAEARPVPAEHLPGPVPAVAPQEGAHAAQVHWGWYVSRHWDSRRNIDCHILITDKQSSFPDS